MEARSISIRNGLRLAPFLIGLLTAILWLQPFSQITASATPLKPQSAVISPLVVDAQTAEPNFPDVIKFRLKAHGLQVKRATLNYKLVGDPVTSGTQQEIASAIGSLDLNANLDLATHYMPPGTELTYYWTLENDSSEAVDTPSQTLKVLDNRYKWKQLTNIEKHVSVHWYEGSASFGQALLDTASGTLDRLQKDIGAGLQRPADVWVYATQDELKGALPKHTPEWVGGKAFPELALVLAAIANDNSADTEIKRVVPHELSHLVLYQAALNPYNSPPAWLDEGMAVYNQETHYPEEEAVLKDAAEKGQLVPLRALSGSFGADQDTALLSYSEGRSAVEFILTDSRYGPEKLARTIAAFHGGVTYDEALKAGLGVTVDELDQQWRAALPYTVGSNKGTQSTAPPNQKPVSGRGQLAGSSAILWLSACGIGGVMVIALIAFAVVIVLRRRPV